MRILVWIILAIIAVGCTPQPQHTDWKPPHRNGFAENLAAEYTDFADSLSELGFKEAATIMAQKGQQAANNTPPSPEPPTSTMEQLHQRLMIALEERPKRIVAQTAARAQVLYDCKTLHSPSLPPEITDGCLEEFHAALGVLESILQDLIPRYQNTLYFEENSAALSPESYKKIGTITSQILTLDDYQIAVVGHSAPSDAPKQDWTLAHQRAERVAQALTEAGIFEGRIRFSSLGSSAPLAGITEPAKLNRVAIRIHTHE